MKKIVENVIIRFYNSSFYYHIYYKHTKKHKQDLQDVHDRVMKIRMEIIGK